MKTRLLALIISLIFSFPAWAELNLEPLLNRVTVQFTASQWITTQTALVNVAVNAAVTDQGIEQVQNNVLQKLNQFSNAAWHILSFNRQQDSSGLEKITIIAQARLPQAELTNLRTKAKQLSKPGETYTIESVQFTPSDDEMRAANVQLRNNLYTQIKAEVDTLNKLYPDQKYYVHQVDFAQLGPIMPMPMNQIYAKETVLGAAAAARPPAININVGNKAEMTASAVLASMPMQVAQQLPKL